MANYATLKAAIEAVVKTNGNQEITGANLQTVLLAIVNSLGADYQFAGVATPSTDVGTPDQNVFYITGVGDFLNMGDAVSVPIGSIGLFKYNGSWTADVINLGTQTIYKTSTDSVYGDKSVYINSIYYVDRVTQQGVTVAINDTFEFDLNDNNQYLVLRGDTCSVISGANMQNGDVLLLWYVKDGRRYVGGALFDDYISRTTETLYKDDDIYILYPSTSTGYYRISNNAVALGTSSDYEKSIVNVQDWQGEFIYVNAYLTSNARVIFTDVNSAILKSYTLDDFPQTHRVRVPADAVSMYISNRVTTNPNLYIGVPKDKVQTGNSLLNVNYLNPVNHFIHTVYNGTVTDGKGLKIEAGTGNGLQYNKCIQLDNWSYCARIETITNQETVNLGTVITQPASVNHATRMEVDFAAQTLKIYNNSTSSLAVQTSLTNINGNVYMLKLERIDRAIKATVYNEKTGVAVSVTSNDGTGSSAGINAAGKMFDCPMFYVGSGSVYLKDVSATSLVNPKVLFVGDSITQGAHTDYDKTWSVMAGEYFGNCLTGGRGSGDVWCCLNQVRSIVPVLKPKAVVVTIGTNNTYEQMSEGGFIGLYRSIVNVIKGVGAIPIVNNIVACDSRINAVTEANNVITSVNEIGCRFDLATSINNDWADGQNNTYYYTDLVHLNDDGNELLYNIIINELGYLKNI